MTKKTGIILASAACAAAAVLAGVLIYSAKYQTVGGNGTTVRVERNASVLDLSNSELDSLAGLEKLKRLERLDLRGLDIEPEEIAALRRKLPDCEILFDLRLSTGKYDSGVTELSLPDASADDIPLLELLDGLRAVSFGGCELYEEMESYAESHPEISVSWSVNIGGKRYPFDTESVNADGLTGGEVSKLKWLKKLKSVLLTGTDAYGEIEELKEILPDCEFIYDYTLFGKTITSADSLLDISGTAVGDPNAFGDELAEALKHLPSLKKVDMCGCGLSDEQMGKLCARFPEVKLVWVVTFGPRNHRYEVRTDVTCFSTLLGNDRKLVGNEKDYENLFLYCTDLVALDMGHNSIKDISLISNLKKLKYLIMTDNHIEDISPLAECPDIVFLELNKNRINDVSSLPKMKNLRYATFHYNKIADITPLYTMDKMKILVLSENFDIPAGQSYELKQKLPSCSIYFTLPFGTGTGAEWDALPERVALKKAFKYWYSIENFNDWDDITWK